MSAFRGNGACGEHLIFCSDPLSRRKSNQTWNKTFAIITGSRYPSLIGRRDGRFGSKVGQIGPKWDKSGAFSDQISVHLARRRQMH